MQSRWNMFVMTMSFAVGITCQAGETDSLSPEGIKDAFGLNEFYSRHIRNASRKELTYLKTRKHAGIAIQASWEYVRRSVSIPHSGDPEAWSRLDRMRLQRFIGLLEGRLAVEIPSWWERLLIQTRASADTSANVWLRAAPKEKDFFFTEVSIGTDEDQVLWTPMSIDSISRTSKGLIVTIANTRLTVPQTINQPWGLNAAHVADDRWLAVINSAGYAPCTLIYLNARTGKEIWRAKVWGEVPIGFKSGKGFFHWIDFRTRDDTVLVFGALNGVFYVEEFSLEDGTNVFRFSTSYCVGIGHGN